MFTYIRMYPTLFYLQYPTLVCILHRNNAYVGFSFPYFLNEIFSHQKFLFRKIAGKIRSWDRYGNMFNRTLLIKILSLKLKFELNSNTLNFICFFAEIALEMYLHCYCM